MFARWTQENFFKYLIHEYDLDRMAYYLTNEINEELVVVNPVYSKLSSKLKSEQK